MQPLQKVFKTGSGRTLASEAEWETYRTVVYEYLFFNNKKWTFDGQSVFFGGQSIHYSDFMKAKRGSL